MVSRKLYSPDAMQWHDDEESLALSSGRNVLVKFYLIAKLKLMWVVCTSHADYISCDVTSSDVDHVTSLHIGVVSPTSDEIGDVASTSLGLIPWKVFIIATVLARKFHKHLQNFRWKDAWLYVYTFCLKKSLSGTETMARRVSSWLPLAVKPRILLFFSPAQLVEVVTTCSAVSVPSTDLAAKSLKYWCSSISRPF